jgi:hypothetical protein
LQGKAVADGVEGTFTDLLNNAAVVFGEPFSFRWLLPTFPSADSPPFACATLTAQTVNLGCRVQRGVSFDLLGQLASGKIQATIGGNRFSLFQPQSSSVGTILAVRQEADEQLLLLPVCVKSLFSRSNESISHTARARDAESDATASDSEESDMEYYADNYDADAESLEKFHKWKFDTQKIFSTLPPGFVAVQWDDAPALDIRCGFYPLDWLQVSVCQAR